MAHGATGVFRVRALLGPVGLNPASASRFRRPGDESMTIQHHALPAALGSMRA